MGSKSLLEKKLHQLIKGHGSRQQLARQLKVHVSKISRLLNGEEASFMLALKIDVLSQGDIPAESILKHVGHYNLAYLIKQVKAYSHY